MAGSLEEQVILMLGLTVFLKLFPPDLMPCICAYSIMELEFARVTIIRRFCDSLMMLLPLTFPYSRVW